ncbi:protein kinase domain containing protein [Nitzschia inconspicua]|uniref:Protein kinase domain containing protein n=1 Tax=Nitzschia inconspicua TaxID=303405 RepID=A0A9K3LKN2_9STRA|nr:protein kinase domain containing protein [Nitzschia inconspicua]KAG7362586.1 protein kinase domain containing protein [Nitzschia inconspicua]
MSLLHDSQNNDCSRPSGISEAEETAADAVLNAENQGMAQTNAIEGQPKPFFGSTLSKTLEERLSRFEAIARQESSNIVQSLENQRAIISSTPYFPLEVLKMFDDAADELIKAHLAVDEKPTSDLVGVTEQSESFQEGHLAVGEKSTSDLDVTEESESFESMMVHLSDEKRQIINSLHGDQRDAVARTYVQDILQQRMKDAQHRAQLQKKDAQLQMKDAQLQMKDAQLQKKDEQLQMKDEQQRAQLQMKDVTNHVTGTFWKMKDDVVLTQRCLDFMAGMSQAEATTTGKTLGTDTNNAIQAAAEKGFEGMYVPGETPEGVVSLFERKKELDHTSYYCPNLSDMKIIRYSQLKMVSKTWSNLIMQSDILPTNLSKEHENQEFQFQKGLELLRNSFTQGLAENELSAKTSFPNSTSGEVRYAQPAFIALLHAISSSWNGFHDSGAAGYSPFKTQVKPNQIVPPTKYRQRRIADLCLEKPGRFQLLMFDYSARLLFEMKPLFRCNMTPDKLDEESGQQVVSHLSKFLSHCLNLHGCGTSSFATGLTGTLAYVKIYKLELVMQVASGDCKGMTALQLHESKRLPIMTRECFDKWVKTPMSQQNGKGGTLNELSQSLYGENGKEGLDEHGIPIGIRLLWELMPLRRQKLFGPNYKELFCDTNISELLGSGSFSVVFSLRESENFILKVPTFARLHHILNEKEVLRKLQRFRYGEEEDMQNIGLPVLEKTCDIKFELGNVSCATQGLVMSPKGIPVVAFLQSDISTPSDEFINSVIDRIDDALKFIHRCNIFHLDVSPKNLVMVTRKVDGRDQHQVFLVDFGSAHAKGEKLYGFHGTPSYAHKDIFMKYPGKEWTVDVMGKKYDYFSFALTLCALKSGGTAKWSMEGFPRSMSTDVKNKFQQKLRERQEAAKAVIDTSKSAKKRQWLRWLSDGERSNSKSRKRKARC